MKYLTLVLFLALISCTKPMPVGPGLDPKPYVKDTLITKGGIKIVLPVSVDSGISVKDSNFFWFYGATDTISYSLHCRFREDTKNGRPAWIFLTIITPHNKSGVKYTSYDNFGEDALTDPNHKQYGGIASFSNGSKLSLIFQVTTRKAY